MASVVAFCGVVLERLCWKSASRRKPERLGESWVLRAFEVEDDSLYPMPKRREERAVMERWAWVVFATSARIAHAVPVMEDVLREVKLSP